MLFLNQFYHARKTFKENFLRDDIFEILILDIKCGAVEGKSGLAKIGLGGILSVFSENQKYILRTFSLIKSSFH